MWWCQFVDVLKFETRPSSLLNFGMAKKAKYAVIGTENDHFLR